MSSGDNCSLREFYLSVPSTNHKGMSNAILSGLESVQQLMSEIDRKVNHIFSGGDPIVGEWFLVRQTYLPFLLCACYITFCTLMGPALMRNRKPFDLRGPMVVFNFGVVAVYVVSIITSMIYLPTLTWQEFCLSGVVERGTYKYTLACLAWIAYIIKYVEYLDTVFFVLRKKTNQMSLLHIVHHTAVPLMGWILLRTETNGIQSIPAIINSLVHIIMYSYYGMAAMGPQVQKYLWWKKYLTQLQIAQFVIIILFVAVVVPLAGCRILPSAHIMIIAMTSLFLYLFYRFYQATFRQKKD